MSYQFEKKNATDGRGMAMPCPLEYIDVPQQLFKLVQYNIIHWSVMGKIMLEFAGIKQEVERLANILGKAEDCL
ncbi:hypothetical protein H6G33_26340 [Calothrix sp. FACHB-1219]|uniref:hypothetical protein n=1 Tax=unclassified Calothrix TaxID=2619626 RepID=UPI0016821033|nr:MULTISPECIES: hypothetical protein [unclassified Calothrix]MBD2204221.1 hypothetical protein [Calothrix sp. FACHB-168]MBD2220527.1 hypothetical protein [Calothrix sp. FACHB-1219]